MALKAIQPIVFCPTLNTFLVVWSLGVRNNGRDLMSIKPDPAVGGSPELDEKQSAAIFINFHTSYPFIPTVIHFHPLSSIIIHFRSLSSTFIHFHSLSSTFINFHPLLSTLIHVHPLSSTFIHYHPLSFTFIYISCYLTCHVI